MSEENTAGTSSRLARKPVRTPVTGRHSCEMTNVSGVTNNPERARRFGGLSAVIVTATAHRQCSRLPPLKPYEMEGFNS